MTPEGQQRIRFLLLLLGVLLLAWVIYQAGPEQVLETARAGLGYLPYIVLCNVAYYLFEALGQRALLGPERRLIPTAVFLRATLAAFVANVLLPAGRAGAETVRVTAYAKYVGGTRTLAASAAFQVPALWATAILIGPCAVVGAAALGARAPLTWVFAIHAGGSACLGCVLFLLFRKATLGQRVGRWLPRFAARAVAFDEATAFPSRRYLSALAWAVAARVTEVAMFAIVFMAVGLPLLPTRVLLAVGIQVVGGTVGEAIPGQLGAVEGSFSLFAGALGLEPLSSRAVAIPLLMRVGQYTLAALALAFLSPSLGRRSLKDDSSATPP